MMFAPSQGARSGSQPSAGLAHRGRWDLRGWTTAMRKLRTFDKGMAKGPNHRELSFAPAAKIGREPNGGSGR